MNIAIILVVVIVVGVAGYFLVMKSKTAAPLPMDKRAPIAVVAAAGDTKSVIDGAAAKATQNAALVQAASLVASLGPARLSPVT